VQSWTVCVFLPAQSGTWLMQPTICLLHTILSRESKGQPELTMPLPGAQVAPTPQLQLTETVRNDVNLKKQTLKLNKASLTLTLHLTLILTLTSLPLHVSLVFLYSEQNLSVKFEGDPQSADPKPDPPFSAYCHTDCAHVI
jgi:hypothetical protein